MSRIGPGFYDVKFNGNSIQFVKWHGVWVIPAKLLGKALGYAKDGEKLSDLISGPWGGKFSRTTVRSTERDLDNLPGFKDHPSDVVMLMQDALREFKEHTDQFGLQAPQLLVLSINGVIKVLTKSRANMADSFRSFLASKGKELLGNNKLPPKKVGSEKGNMSNTKKDAKPGVVLKSAVDDLCNTLRQMYAMKLLTKAELKQYLLKVAEIQFVRLSKETGVTHIIAPDGIVPSTQVAAMAKGSLAVREGNFRVVTRENPYHPAYPGFLPASEIGKPFGLGSDRVKKYCTKFCANESIELPNNDAKEFVELNNGNFPAPDEHGFLIFKPRHKHGVALLMKMEGNTLNWRNYWSPEAVSAIRALISKDHALLENGNGTSVSTQVSAASIVMAAKAQEPSVTA